MRRLDWLVWERWLDGQMWMVWFCGNLTPFPPNSLQDILCSFHIDLQMDLPSPYSKALDIKKKCIPIGNNHDWENISTTTRRILFKPWSKLTGEIYFLYIIIICCSSTLDWYISSHRDHASFPNFWRWGCVQTQHYNITILGFNPMKMEIETNNSL